MVPAAGVEPATFRSGGERSNPLSYAGLSLGKITLATKKHKRYAYIQTSKNGRVLHFVDGNNRRKKYDQPNCSNLRRAPGPKRIESYYVCL